MDRVETKLINDPQRPSTHMVIGVLQEVNIIAVCKDAEKDTTYEVVLTRNVRPIPVPYTEEP